MVCVHCETAIVQSYVVQFAAMWIICSLFCSEREAVSTSLIPVMPLLAFLTVFACTFHFYLFTRPNDVSMDFTLHEHFLKEQYDSIPIGAVVVGSCLEGIIPAWETGHRYYDMEIEPLGFLPGYSEKLRSYYKIAASYSIEEGFDIKANAQD